MHFLYIQQAKTHQNSRYWRLKKRFVVMALMRMIQMDQMKKIPDLI